jgi:ASC-1-like (ASCH) protein
MSKIQRHTKHLSEPHFTNVCTGLKTVEGRPGDGSFSQMKVGDVITFWNNDDGHHECPVRIIRITRHATFRDLFTAHTLGAVLPGTSTIEEGLKVYKDIYPRLFDPKTGEEIVDPKVGRIGLVVSSSLVF